MPTINQLTLTKIRKHRPRRTFKLALKKCPQKKAYVIRIAIRSPKKPNSAKRKTARVFISSTRRSIYCAIIGIGHSLLKWSNVLLRGGRRRDIPGVRYVAIRGKYDLQGVRLRRSKRSKYGIRFFA